MSCLFGADCCLRSPEDQYKRAIKYIKEAEAKTKPRNRYDFSSGDKPTPDQLKLYYKAIALLQKIERSAKADFALGVLYSRGIMDDETRDKLNGKKGLISRCFASCFERPLPIIPTKEKWLPPRPENRVVDAAISRLTSAKQKGHPRAAALLTWLENDKAQKLNDWEEEVKRVQYQQRLSDMDKSLENSRRAIREVEEIHERRREQERFLKANPSFPLQKRIEEQQEQIELLKRNQSYLESRLAGCY